MELWQHQKDAIEKASTLNNFALFMEMGTGKTATMIHILRHIYNSNRRILRTLILTPPIVVRQWKDEFARFSKVPPASIGLLTGSQTKRVEKVERHPILISNYEALLMGDLFEAFKKWQPEVIVLDESHKIKNYTSKRTKAAIKLAPMAKYRYLLSGTPVLNTPMDLFSQFLFLDGGKTLMSNFYAFRNTFFYDKNAGMPKHIHFPNWQPKAGSYEKLTELISPVSVRIKKSECLDLPPLVRKVIKVELSAEQKKHYEAMRDDFITYVGSQACVASLAITKALRLQQIVSGHLRVESGPDDETGAKTIQFKTTPREEALHELLEEITPHHKVLVWAVFKDNYQAIKRICEAIGVKYVEVHGEISDSGKRKAVDCFRDDPEFRVYIGHPGSGGIGLNLTASSYSIFYSRGFSLEYDLQAEARNHRGGSEVHEKITRLDLVAENTIDELILERLSAKQEMGEKIIFELAQKLTSQ